MFFLYRTDRHLLFGMFLGNFLSLNSTSASGKNVTAENLLNGGFNHGLVLYVQIPQRQLTIFSYSLLLRMFYFSSYFILFLIFYQFLVHWLKSKMAVEVLTSEREVR